jgi:hypothetical protein
MKLIKERIQGFFNIFVAALFCLAFYSFYSSSVDYRPNESRIYVDMANKPIGKQNLLGYANHNPQYGKDKDGVTDFITEGLLRQFTFTFDEISSNSHRDEMRVFYSDKGFNELYPDFLNLSYMKLIDTQEGIAEARMIGKPVIKDSTTSYEYEGRNPVKPQVITFLVTAKVFVEVFGNEDVTQLYNVRAYVQRAYVEDKLRGYQIIRLELTQ